MSVTDSGHGIDPGVLPHLFEPFFTTKGPGRGSGLGLSTVHGIITQSGGHIHVASAVGQGSTFGVYLPATDEPVSVPPVPAQSAGERHSKQGGRILLVEDEEMIRDVTDMVLRQHGYDVVCAASGEEALAALDASARTIDLLLTDVVLPGAYSGPTLAAQVQSRGPGVRVLFVSGYTDETIAEHGLDMPNVAFLQKPYDIDELTGKVREVLGAEGA
jgi:two-component system, cell cycle sensor histidine kinase and response regulator CckA